MYVILTLPFILFVDTSLSCELYYNTPDGICFQYGSIGRDHVFFNSSVDTKDSLNSKLMEFNAALHRKVTAESFPLECIDLIFGLMCHISFPLCDYSSDTPMPRKVCNSTH